MSLLEATRASALEVTSVGRGNSTWGQREGVEGAFGAVKSKAATRSSDADIYAER